MRVLFLTHRLPYAPNRGDRIRAFHILHHLRTRMDVHLFSLVHDAVEEAHAGELRHAAASVTTARVSRPRNLLRVPAAMFADRPLTHVLLDSSHANPALRQIVAARSPDVVLAYCSGMARFALEPPLDRIPFVLDMVDVDSVKWSEMARTAPFPMGAIYAREARLLRRFEAFAVRKARATLVVNDREREAVDALTPDARVAVIGNGIDVGAFRPTSPPSGEPVVIFCGVMNYGPNVQGAQWLASDVWPTVRDRRPDARLVLAGANPATAVRRLAAADPTISVTGTVDDVRPFLWKTAVAAAPLFVARGIQNKVVEAIAAGLPCVVSRPVLDGLPDDIKPACIAADSAAAFAQGLLQLLDAQPLQRREIAARAELQTLEWRQRLEPLAAILADAGKPASPAVQ